MKKEFLGNDFLLQSSIAEKLFFDYAQHLPIIDYHNHLPPEKVAEDHCFDNLTKIWLDGDHYKWRAMRALGVNEKYITGDASDSEKFRYWAKTVPQTLRNPLYHWTHMELQKPFGIRELLHEETAEKIYSDASEKLKTKDFSTQNILRKMRVEVICTTDDPLDSLQSHKALSGSNTPFKMLPTWRPDKAMEVSEPKTFLEYKNKLEIISDIEISDLDSYIQALQKRHDFFNANGCKLSDHGLQKIVFKKYSAAQVEKAFKQLMECISLSSEQQAQLQSFLLVELAKMDHTKGWVQQFHLGAIRNNNSRMLRELGPDTGFDSIGDFSQAESMSAFFDVLDNTNQLPKTIVYNLNPAHNEVFATMMGNFNSGGIRGKMQMGSGWWFLDQLDGMEKQLNTISNMGLLSCFIGMLTDSRSFLSFPRHEYFRRLLCNLLANDIIAGKIPEDYALVGQLVENICYYNAKNYFDF